MEVEVFRGDATDEAERAMVADDDVDVDGDGSGGGQIDGLERVNAIPEKA